MPDELWEVHTELIFYLFFLAGRFIKVKATALWAPACVFFHYVL